MSDFLDREPVKLHPRHLEFCARYLRDFDAVGSYQEIYGEDMSDVVAKTSAYRILDRDDVREYLDYKIWASVKDSEVMLSNPAELIKELRYMATDEKFGYRYPSVKMRAVELWLRMYNLLDNPRESLSEQRRVIEDRIMDRRGEHSGEVGSVTQDSEVDLREPLDDNISKDELIEILDSLHYRDLQVYAMSVGIPGNTKRKDMARILADEGDLDGILEWLNSIGA